MKKLELKKIIKEEIRNLLVEDSNKEFDKDMITLIKQFQIVLSYNNIKKNYIRLYKTLYDGGQEIQNAYHKYLKK